MINWVNNIRNGVLFALISTVQYTDIKRTKSHSRKKPKEKTVNGR